MAYKYQARDFKKSLVFINGTPYRAESIYSVSPVVFDGKDYTFEVHFLNGSIKHLFFPSKEAALQTHEKLERLL